MADAHSSHHGRLCIRGCRRLRCPRARRCHPARAAWPREPDTGMRVPPPFMRLPMARTVGRTPVHAGPGHITAFAAHRQCRRAGRRSKLAAAAMSAAHIDNRPHRVNVGRITLRTEHLSSGPADLHREAERRHPVCAARHVRAKNRRHTVRRLSQAVLECMRALLRGTKPAPTG